MRLRILLACAVLAAADAAAAQERQLHGRVVDASTDAPVMRARIMAEDERSRAVAVTDSDEQGDWSLTVPASATTLQVVKAAYARTSLPMPRATELTLRLAPGAVITGRVLDAAGVPMAGMFLRALPADAAAGAQSPFEAIVDERGEFRIGGLPEGRYRVSGEANTIAVHTENVDVSAGPIALRAGEQVQLQAVRLPAQPCREAAFNLPVARGRTVALRGRVLDASGLPLACTLVRAAGDAGSVSTWTDAEGRFQFRSVLGDSFTVEVGRPPYTGIRRGPFEVPASATATLPELELRVPLAPIIAGRVFDERGEPIQGSAVMAQPLHRVDGQLIAGGAAAVPTDDLGQFRLLGLSPGRYIITSTSDGPRPVSRVGAESPSPVYYPGVSDVRLATVVEVGAGGLRDGVDIQRPRVQGVTVSGVVTGVSGEPLSEGFAELAVAARSGAIQASVLHGRVAGGRFSFPEVPPGEYVVQVGRNTGRVYEFGREFITVDDTTPPVLTMQLTEGHLVRGRITVDGSAPLPRLLRVGLAAANRDEAPLSVLVSPDPAADEDGAFRANNVIGTQRVVLVNAPEGWYLKSVRVGGRETVDEPFDFGFGSEPIRDVDVVVSPNGGRVTGTLRGTGPRRDYTAVVFSTSASDWYQRSPRVRLARSGADGRFSVAGLPPGTYYAALAPPSIVSALPSGAYIPTSTGPQYVTGGAAWEDYVSLDTLTAQAVRLSLDEGQTRDVQLSPPAP